VKSIRIFIALLSLVVMVGCATGPKYTPAPAAPEGSATIYFMNSSYGGVVSPLKSFCVNSVKIGSIGFGGYTWITAKPGDYVIGIAGMSGCPEDYGNAKGKLKINTTIESGGIYIVEYKTVDMGVLVETTLEITDFEDGGIHKKRLQGSRYSESLVNSI